MSDIQYGSNIQAAIEDPNGLPGRTRGGVPASVSTPAELELGYRGQGPSPYPQNKSIPDPLTEAFGGVGPEG